MILKCAQHIRLPEHSHPPKLIKSYIAISCLIKATLCSENPAQLTNGCYSMKADCICLRDIQRGKQNPHLLCHILNTRTHIMSPKASRDQGRPRWAEMVLSGMALLWSSWKHHGPDWPRLSSCQLRYPSPEVLQTSELALPGPNCHFYVFIAPLLSIWTKQRIECWDFPALHWSNPCCGPLRTGHFNSFFVLSISSKYMRTDFILGSFSATFLPWLRSSVPPSTTCQCVRRRMHGMTENAPRTISSS